MKNLKIIFLLCILISTSISANTAESNVIDVTKGEQLSLLENSTVYFSEEQLTVQEVLNEDQFETYHKPYINIGASRKTIWIKLQLQNPTEKPVEKVLILTSPLLETITLYNGNDLSNPIIKGVSNISKDHTTLYPFYTIELAGYTSQEYYLKIRSLYEPVDFRLRIEDKNRYLAEDRAQQFINILLIGMVLALMIYSFLVSFYTKDKSYSFYSFYLFFLIYQQMTYLGLTQIYFPTYFILIDIKIPVIKIGILVITAALFAMYFLKTKQKPLLNKIYKFFILLVLLEMFILSLPGMYNLDIVIITGAFFIIFNLTASIISYLQGYKQARLFIVGFSIVFFSYLLIILDALGLTSIMQDFQNILMFGTAFEALILSLAFADRYVILQNEKEEVDARILIESKERAAIIENEVVKKTDELNHALKTKELLLEEVNHRVKNNLQVILSIIRLQNNEIEDEDVKEKFISLENRINAIAKTYNTLLVKGDLVEIDMQEYIDSLLADIQETLDHEEQQISIKTDIDVMIPLRESVYIGLIINELVSNAYKYAFDDDKGKISISLHHDKDDYLLIIEDNGKGFVQKETNTTLGLKLIHTLIYDQLGGDMKVLSNDHTKYSIRFRI
jgi:two-component sensor histidine kinase